MAFCRNCGAELNPDEKFCPQCGASTATEEQDTRENQQGTEKQYDQQPNPHNADPATLHPDSYFAGSTLGYVGYMLLLAFGSAITFGIATPWIMNAFFRWKKQHTFIDGQQLDFDGTGTGLFFKYIKWLVLSIITLTIYAWFIPLKMERWVDSHTFFAE